MSGSTDMAGPIQSGKVTAPDPGRSATFGIVILLALSACSAQGTSSDTAELRNIKWAHQVPKSTPAQMVKAFDRFCAKGPQTANAAEKTLRTAGYVPLPRRTTGARAYVIDNKKPAVAVSEKMCLVQVSSRTGQTTRVQQYVAKTYPTAQPIDPGSLGDDIEQAWSIPSHPPALIATERTESFGWYRYALILFRPGAS